MTGSQLKIEITALLDQLISDKYPETLDDELPDVLSDGDKRSDAIDQLIAIIENYRETL